MRFNPRSRKGNDTGAGSKATPCTAFQSTFPQGERHNPPIGVSVGRVFQSTFPQGERHCYYCIEYVWHCFNPRSRKGNDGREKTEVQGDDVFQSTFPQGERLNPGLSEIIDC